MAYTRTTLSAVALALGAGVACGSPISGPERPSPGAPSLSAQGRHPAYSCTDLAYEGTFRDVVVPAGASCILAHATVTGSVKVLKGASLYSADSHIEGNVESENAASVELAQGVVDGDVIFAGDVGDEATSSSHRLAGVTLTRGDVRIMHNTDIRVAIRGNRILEGSIWVQGNVDSFVTLIANQVGRTVHVVANRGAGSTMVRSTRAGQSVRCHANTTEFSAESNEAPLMQGQCEVQATE